MVLILDNCYYAVDPLKPFNILLSFLRGEIEYSQIAKEKNSIFHLESLYRPSSEAIQPLTVAFEEER